MWRKLRLFLISFRLIKRRIDICDPPSSVQLVLA
jgi:hypothetical protein